MLRVAFLIGVFFAFCGCGITDSAIQTYNLGDRVQAGPLVYTAYGMHWYMAPAHSRRVPANRFLIVRMNITNSGAVDCHVPTLLLIDDSGRTFNEVSNETGIPDWIGVARRIKPLAAETGAVAFDVPPRHYRMRVADETEQILSYIDLPLNVAAIPKGL